MTLRALITGANGLIAGALAKRLVPAYEVAARSHAQLDISDAAAVRRAVDEVRPDLIINGAVIGVDLCERDPALADAVNVQGPRFLAETAERVGAEMMHFSSNYVFGGDGETFLTVQDDARPINEYGRTKLMGEMAVNEACSRSFIIRTSWVFGRGKSSFLSGVDGELRAGRPVSAINDIWASTTYVHDLVARILEVLPHRLYRTYHLVNAGVCSYEEFAQEAARFAGVSDRDADRLIRAVSEKDAVRSPRPTFTPMRCTVSEGLGLAPMRSWRDALREYVQRASPR